MTFTVSHRVLPNATQPGPGGGSIRAAPIHRTVVRTPDVGPGLEIPQREKQAQQHRKICAKTWAWRSLWVTARDQGGGRSQGVMSKSTWQHQRGALSWGEAALTRGSSTHPSRWRSFWLSGANPLVLSGVEARMLNDLEHSSPPITCPHHLRQSHRRVVTAVSRKSSAVLLPEQVLFHLLSTYRGWNSGSENTNPAPGDRAVSGEARLLSSRSY